ncbi:MAG TPA: MaoC family dehydratase N-terminal domain-containing protein [Egibacteraceae bacterium]|nr:MaoC family dehydratase N-terminal domain-containing protein [Egibacteraceae bacterium]
MSRSPSQGACWGRACEGRRVIALNKARVGHRYPSYRYEVSREKIREYANATGVSDPQYAADEGDVVAPPMFAACFTVIRGGAGMFGDAELGAHFALVHGSQEYEFHRPVRLGDVLECTPFIADIQWKGRNEFLTLQVDCNDATTGEPVVTSRGVIVFLGSAPQNPEQQEAS